jgi:hypothetical protein
MKSVFLVAIVIAIAIGFCLIAGKMDHDRIRAYIASKGGKVIKIVWSPFGPGWFGEKSNVIYEVDYYDRDGNHHRAHCKTSMFSDVYLHNDWIVPAMKPRNTHEKQEVFRQMPMSIKEENRRLKKENELLRAEIESFKQQKTNTP